MPADARGRLRLVRTHQPRGQPPVGHDPQENPGDTELILWVLRLHRDNEVESQYVLSCIDTLEGISRGATERHRELRLELKKVDEDRLELLRNLPTGIDKVLVIYEYLLKKAKTKKWRRYPAAAVAYSGDSSSCARRGRHIAAGPVFWERERAARSQRVGRVAMPR